MHVMLKISNGCGGQPIVERRMEQIAWRIGGPQGSGIDRIATLFARACALNGQQVFCRREYHSNIMGRHSYYDVSASNGPLVCHAESPDMLVTFEAEALCRHLNALTSPGYVIHSVDDSDVELTSLDYLDARLQHDLVEQLTFLGLPASTSGLLELASQRGVRSFAVPYKVLLSRLAEELGVAPRRVAAAINTLAVTISSSLLSLPRDSLEHSLEKLFAGQQQALEMNRRAIAIAWEYAEQAFAPLERHLPEQREATGGLLLNASQSVALGKLAAGLGFQSYYPISPASDESVFLEAHQRIPFVTGEMGGPLLLQVEDELSAVTMACGAALTGTRSATATSGPGFSLMTEGLGWAGMNEVPLVITLYQRGGPSTGMPTRTDQGDLQSAVHGGHGEFPRMVLASADVEECFYDAAEAFDYAERYQLPVIHLLDKALTGTLQTVPTFDMDRLQIDRGERYQPGDEPAAAVPRFALTDSGISPRPVLGQAGGQHWLTGVEHSEYGQVCEDPVMREQMMEKRARKLLQVAREIPASAKLQLYGDREAAFTLITWGSNKGAVLDALKRLTQEGIRARAVQLRLLWPFPAEELEAILADAAPLVMVEGNYSGQLNTLLRAQLGRGCDHLVVKYSGRPISGEALHPVLQQIHAGQGEARMVLRNPYE
jgi:2-oxoglutarate ferredoxin oxidoreductase subunit alpha